MKFTYLLLVAATIVLIACNKDKYQTTPQISIKSMNSIVPPGGTLDALLSFTDKQGDLGGDTLTSIRVRLNQIPTQNTAGPDTVYNQIAQFPNKSQGQLELVFLYTDLHESDTENDTFMFKFTVKDRAGHTSDTVSSGKVVVLFQ